jgi:hypothetical protein
MQASSFAAQGVAGFICGQNGSHFRASKLAGGRRSTLLCGVSIAVLLGSAIAASAQQVTTSPTVTGQVITPQTYNLSSLQALPATTENVSFLSGTTPTNLTFAGVPLWTLLGGNIKTNPAVRNDILGDVVIVTGSDGYQSVSTVGEIDPACGGTQPNPQIVAYASAPGQLLTTDGFARTTAPSDVKGGRYVSNVASIQIMHDPVNTGTYSGGLSSQLTVNGMVTTPTTLNLSALTAMPSTTVTVAGGTTYTGVPLWTLLTNIGVTTNPQVKNNILRDYVIATGSDGYQATVSMGEINPSFGGNAANPDIIAYAMNGGAPGTSLGSSGFARLITPADNMHGRWVSNQPGGIRHVELAETSSAKH